MSYNHLPSQTDPPVTVWLKVLVLLLGVAAAALLLVGAQTMTICEDEANGFYLCKQPLGEVLSLMLANVHEDPPLSDVILHYWTAVAGYRPGLLRLVPIVFWALMIPGLYLVGRCLLDRRAGWLAVAALFLLPYHWTIPAVFRWYSLFACLAVWNFYFFLRLDRLGRAAADTLPATRRQTLPWGASYVLSGAALWYTNYAAPVLFFTHLVVAVCRADRRRILTRLVVCWFAIGLLFAPWLPTFLRQLGISVRDCSIFYKGLSLYVLWAGEFSTPFDYWISLPAALACLSLAVLVAVQARRCWIPALVCGLTLAALLYTGAIGPKRMLIVSPFLAITCGVALARLAESPRWVRAAGCSLVGALLIVAAGSLVNMVRRDGWVAYRWLDPIETVAEHILRQSPQPLVISDSNPVFFYLNSPCGKAQCRRAQEGNGDYDPKLILYPLQDNYSPLRQRLLAGADSAVWVFHSAYHGPISRCYDDMVDQMQQLGFRVVKQEPFLRASPKVLNLHPRFRSRSPNPLDSHRIVLVHFARTPAPNALPLATAHPDENGLPLPLQFPRNLP